MSGATPIRAGDLPGDVADSVDLWVRVMVERDGPRVADEVRARVLAAFARPIVRFAVAGSGAEGFALAIRENDGGALLSRLAVRPESSSRGIGRALTADAVEHARREGCTRIRLDVRIGNARAAAIYRSAGFAIVSAPWDYDGGEPLVTWSLDL